MKQDNFNHQLPLKNFHTKTDFTLTSVSYLYDDLYLKNVAIEVNSQKAGPYKVEIKYLDIIYDPVMNTKYLNYTHPMFLRANNKI